MNKTKIIPITVPLDRQAHERARYLAARQKTVSQGKQVYLNTLAVCAVSYYLKWLQIESDLEESDRSLNLPLTSNSGDLLIPDCGRLECRPVLPQENHLTIPAQATEERIGYVAVQFAEDLDRVQLIGFLPPVASASDSSPKPYRVQLRGFSPPVAPTSESLQIPLTKLQSLELLLQKVSQPIAQRTKSTSVNLGQWWSKIFEPGWVDLETLFSSDVVTNPAWQVRTEELSGTIDKSNPLQVRRGKLIDLGVKLGNNVFALVITCTSLTNTEVEILLQVYPGDDRVYLPANLEMVVLDETETLVPQLQVKSREADNCIQLSLIGVSGERFSLRLTQEEISFTESFQI